MEGKDGRQITIHFSLQMHIVGNKATITVRATDFINLKVPM